MHGGARRGGRPLRIHHLSSPQAAGALPPPSSTRVACGRHPSSQASVLGRRRPPARHPLGGQAGGALMCRSSTASPLRLCASTQTRDALRVKHGLPTLHRQPPQLGCRRHPSTSTTTSARLPAERRGTPHHRRPPWLGFWWSGVIDVHLLIIDGTIVAGAAHPAPTRR